MASSTDEWIVRFFTRVAILVGFEYCSFSLLSSLVFWCGNWAVTLLRNNWLDKIVSGTRYGSMYGDI